MGTPKVPLVGMCSATLGWVRLRIAVLSSALVGSAWLGFVPLHKMLVCRAVEKAVRP